MSGKELPWYRSWITSPGSESEYWNTGFWAEFKKISEKVNIPIMFQGGWFDIFLASAIKTFLKLPEKTRNESRFIIGPWHHGNQPGGDLDYPNENILGTMQIKSALEWFDHHLKGSPYNHAKGVVEAYVIGEGVWKTWDSWIQASDTKKLYLIASSKMRYKGGKLDDQSSENTETISYNYNPEDPVISKGGNLIANYNSPEKVPECSVVQDEPGAREDVITFISEPMEEDLRITGNIRVHLNVSSDAEDTAFTAKVMEVFPEGKANNIQDSITTLTYRNGAVQPLVYTPGEIVELKLELLTIIWMVKKGSRIRLDVSSSNFPAYHSHPNVAGIWSLQKDLKIAEQTLHLGGIHPSYIEIPFTY